jgi:hypothetical protein
LELTTDQKGTVAETAIVFAAVKLGIEVYLASGEGGRKLGRGLRIRG